MAEQIETLQPQEQGQEQCDCKITRRDMLKVAGVGAAVVAIGVAGYVVAKMYLHHVQK